MNKMINIIQQDDEFQRYKMPVLEIKYSNKKFTLLENIGDIAKHLHIKEDIIIKYISIENNTNNKNNKLNGIFQQNDLQKIIYTFIEKFVLCDKCGLPELKHKAYDKHILNKCLSCGEKYLTNDNHKVKKYWSNKYPKKFNHKKFTFYNQGISNESLGQDKIHAEKLEYLLDENYASASYLDEIKSFSSFIKNDYTTEEIYEKIKLVSLAYRLNQNKLIQMLFLLLDLSSFDSLLESIKNNGHIFNKFVTSCECFMKMLETLLHNNQEYLDRSYKIVCLLYDLEVFEEEDIIEWYDNQDYDDIYNTFKHKSRVFVDWLKNCNEYEN
jgi:translation initiation factor 2 beta subunit (eIF-2beta)/eIF-5